MNLVQHLLRSRHPSPLSRAGVYLSVGGIFVVAAAVAEPDASSAAGQIDISPIALTDDLGPTQLAPIGSLGSVVGPQSALVIDAGSTPFYALFASDMAPLATRSSPSEIDHILEGLDLPAMTADAYLDGSVPVPMDDLY